MLRADVVASTAAFTQECWEELDGSDCFYVSHPWLGALEADDAFHTDYVRVARDGAVLAAVPCARRTGQGDALARAYDVAALSGGMLDPSTAALIAGSRSGYANRLLVRSGLAPEHRVAATAAALDEVRQAAARGGCTAAIWPYLPRSDAQAILAAAGRRAHVLLGSVDCVTHIDGGGTAGLLQRLGRTTRKGIRRERAAFAQRTDLVTAIEPLDAVADELPSLLLAVRQRYGRTDTLRELEDYVTRQASHAGLVRRSRVVTCRVSGRLVAYSLFYAHGRAWYARSWGILDDYLGPPWLYFNLDYVAIDAAAAEGVERIELGTGSYAAKLSRGARPRPTWTVVVDLDDDDTASAIGRRIARRNGELADAWSARLGGSLTAGALQPPRAAA